MLGCSPPASSSFAATQPPDSPAPPAATPRSFYTVLGVVSSSGLSRPSGCGPSTMSERGGPHRNGVWTIVARLGGYLGSGDAAPARIRSLISVSKCLGQPGGYCSSPCGFAGGNVSAHRGTIDGRRGALSGGGRCARAFLFFSLSIGFSSAGGLTRLLFIAAHWSIIVGVSLTLNEGITVLGITASITVQTFVYYRALSPTWIRPVPLRTWAHRYQQLQRL